VSDLPDSLYFNPTVMRNRLHERAWQIYARKNTLPGDVQYIKAYPTDKIFFEMRDAMQEFVDRCDRGEVLSKYTYAKFKDILERAG